MPASLTLGRVALPPEPAASMSSKWVTDAHELAVDSKLNIYTVGAWQREVKKSVFKGMRPLK